MASLRLIVRSTSPFITPRAVDAWDAHFRWRENGRLRDLTIDSTWERVAGAIAGTGDDAYRRELLDAFASWQMLPDVRILARAGTASWRFDNEPLCAVLNIAMFVRSPCTSRAGLDLAGIERSAALAVRALDDVATAQPSLPRARLRVGVIGMADALSLLNLAYENPSSRIAAMRTARAVATGCTAASVRLAAERGAQTMCSAIWARKSVERGVPKALVDEAMKNGLRHDSLTAITPQPLLAALANCVANALDPLESQRSRLLNVHVDPDAVGYAEYMRRELRGNQGGSNVPSDFTSVIGQLEMRGAMQQWIDEPVDYPVVMTESPDPAAIARWSTASADLGLGELSWEPRYTVSASPIPAPSVTTN